MKIKYQLLSLLVIMGLLLAACGQAAPAPAPAPAEDEEQAAEEPAVEEEPAAEEAVEEEAPAAAEDLMPITIAAAAAIDHVTVFAAVDNGIFEKYGLDAKVNLYPTGVEIVNALQSGEAQVGIFGSVPLLTSVSNDIPLVLISYNHGDPNRKYYNDNQGVVAGPETGLGEGDIAGLAGKKVGLPVGSGAEPYFLGLLEAEGVDPDSVEIVNVKPADMPAALVQGSVDAISIWEPWQATVLKEVSGSVRIVRGSSPGWFDPGTTVSTVETIAENREALKRFLIAHAEIHQWVRQNPDEAAEVATRWITGLDSEVAKGAMAAPVMDVRMSQLTYEGYNEITIPFLDGQGKLGSTFEAGKAIEPSILVEVMNEYPQFFDDLEPIPAEFQLK